MQKIGDLGAKALFFLIPFMGILFTHLIFDYDLWFILNSGRFVVENGFPYTEPFSMHEGLNFVLEQWLTDIIYWEIYSNFGAEAFLSFIIFLGFLMLFLYEKTCFLLSNNAALSKVLTFVFGMVTIPVFLLTRPQSLSTLIFLFEVHLLLKYAKSNNKKFLYAIPIISLLIINLHCALWAMIFILMLPFIATFLARKCTNIDEKYLGAKFDIIPILAVIVLSVLTAFVNPYGLKALTFLFNSYDPSIHGNIGEMQPMMLKISLGSFSFGYSLIFFIYLFAGTALMSKRSTPLYLILLFAGLGFLAMLAARNLFLFNAIGTLVFAYGFRDYEFKITKLNFTFFHLLPFLFIDIIVLYKLILDDQIYDFPLIYIIFLSILFTALIIFALFYKKNDKLSKTKGLLIALLPFFFLLHLYFHNIGSAKDYIGAQYEETVDILLSKNDAKDIRLFTGFNTGAYPEFRGIKCYMDARPEVFAPKNTGKDFSIIGEFYSVTKGKIYYKDFVKKYNFNYMLVEEGDGVLFVMLPHDDDFTLLNEVKDDDGKVIARLYEVKNK